MTTPTIKARARGRVERLEAHRRCCDVLAHASSILSGSVPADQPPGLDPARPASRAANAAIPAAPQCQDGSARSRRPAPIRLSYQNAPSRSRRASARSPESAARAAARLAVVSIPASARSSSTQPIPAVPLSRPTCRADVGSPGSSSQPPLTAARLSHLPAPRASSRYAESPVARAACRSTHAIPATPSSKPEAVQAPALSANGQLTAPAECRHGSIVDPCEEPAGRREIDRIAIAPVALEKHVRGSRPSRRGSRSRASPSRRSCAAAGAFRSRSAPQPRGARACVARNVGSPVRSANASRARTMPAWPMPTP